MKTEEELLSLKGIKFFLIFLLIFSIIFFTTAIVYINKNADLKNENFLLLSINEKLNETNFLFKIILNKNNDFSEISLIAQKAERFYSEASYSYENKEDRKSVV